jgi:hypothetical protein
MTISTTGTNVQVTLHSDSLAIRTLTLGAPGAIITVDANVTLILENIVLQGQPNNNWELLTVDKEGTLIMRPGQKLPATKMLKLPAGESQSMNWELSSWKAAKYALTNLPTSITEALAACILVKALILTYAAG